jgi:hypothetical protein
VARDDGADALERRGIQGFHRWQFRSALSCRTAYPQMV